MTAPPEESYAEDSHAAEASQRALDASDDRGDVTVSEFPPETDAAEQDDAQQDADAAAAEASADTGDGGGHHDAVEAQPDSAAHEPPAVERADTAESAGGGGGGASATHTAEHTEDERETSVVETHVVDPALARGDAAAWATGAAAQRVSYDSLDGTEAATAAENKDGRRDSRAGSVVKTRAASMAELPSSRRASVRMAASPSQAAVAGAEPPAARVRLPSEEHMERSSSSHSVRAVGAAAGAYRCLAPS